MMEKNRQKTHYLYETSAVSLPRAGTQERCSLFAVSRMCQAQQPVCSGLNLLGPRNGTI